MNQGEATVLVTGGCGFIGSHLVDALLAEGLAVRVLDNLSSGRTENLRQAAGRAELVVGDVRDAAAVNAAMAGVTHIFHEAALVSVFDSVNRPLQNHEINIGGTLNVLLAAREHGVRRVVMASSAAVYGNDPELPKRETMRPHPASPYALAKLTGEYYLRLFAELYGVQTVSLRYFNVYGPRQDPSSPYSGVISRFADGLAAGRTPIVFGDGLQTRDFVYVGDVVRANLLAMRSRRAGGGEAVNIGTGRRTSLLELLDTLGRIDGRGPAPEFREARAGDVRDSVADIGAARELLGFEPAVSLEDGLRALLESLTPPPRV